MARAIANNSMSMYEHEYEYDAPRYIDFQHLQEGHLEDDDVDTWFGKETSSISLLLPTCDFYVARGVGPIEGLLQISIIQTVKQELRTSLSSCLVFFRTDVFFPS